MRRVFADTYLHAGARRFCPGHPTHLALERPAMRCFEQMEHNISCVASYSGRGTLTLEDSSAWECDFRIEHHVELGVLLECDFRGSAPYVNGGSGFRSFAGTTSDGEFSLRSVREGHMRSSTFSKDAAGVEVTIFFWLQGVRLERMDKPKHASYRYGITNFKFFGTEARRPGSLPLTLTEKDTSIEIMINKLNNYKLTNDFLTLYRSARITCEAGVDLKACGSNEGTDRAISGLCQTMSVARGTRITWVYRYAYDEQNRLAGMLHYSGWPGRFSPLSIFDDGADHRHEVKRFIETAYPVFVENDEAFELGSNLIESYLAAKLEEDLLERRGVKLVVALEILKDLYLNNHEYNTKEHIISKSKFGKIAKESIKPAIEAALRKNGIEDAAIEEMCEKINELNRTSFAVILRSLFDSVGFHPSDKEIKLFIKQRNELVHVGHFYEYGPEYRDVVYFSHEGLDDATGPDPDPISAAYFFMVNFMDRFFLKFFGYGGRYLNQKIYSIRNAHVENGDTIA